VALEEHVEMPTPHEDVVDVPEEISQSESPQEETPAIEELSDPSDLTSDETKPKEVVNEDIIDDTLSQEGIFAVCVR
jgi:hypothetical protein